MEISYSADLVCKAEEIHSLHSELCGDMESMIIMISSEAEV